MRSALLLLTLLALAACPASPGPSHPKGQGDCGSAGTAKECAELRGCRYLTPGCAEGEEIALPESATGCYPDTPCSDGTCPSGTTCVERVVNPCLPEADGTACDACGELLRVCVSE